MKKELDEMMFPVANYTDKIHVALKMMFATRSWLSFTSSQMKEHLQAGYPWLKTLTPKQSTLLDKLIVTGIKKLIQAGLVKKVTSSVSVASQWQCAKTVAQSGYFNATSESAVAKTDAAKKAIGRRAIGGRSLIRLNNVKPKCDRVEL